VSQTSITVQFQTERKKLGMLHPGDLFYYKRNLWITLNRTDDGRLIRMMGPGCQSSLIVPTKTTVTYLISGKKI